MNTAFYDTHPFDKAAFQAANKTFNHTLHFLETRLTTTTAPLANGYSVVCAFANDRLDHDCLQILAKQGTRLIALRSAGFNHVDLKSAAQLGLRVVRVPEYSPYSVAEHAIGLMLTLNRKFHRAFNRIRELNFSLDGLVGFDMHGKTIGIIGTGRIGSALAHISAGFGCRIIAHDMTPNAQLIKDCHVTYVSIGDVFRESDIISLHVPLTEKTFHLIDSKALQKMQQGVMLINTSRGGLVDTKALITALKSGHIGSAGLDVYEEESGVFFEDHSQDLLQDDVLARLLTFPNVFITSHQGFLTHEALNNIAVTTLENISDFEMGRPLNNEVKISC